jgi:hypothetical protein
MDNSRCFRTPESAGERELENRVRYVNLPALCRTQNMANVEKLFLRGKMFTSVRGVVQGSVGCGRV